MKTNELYHYGVKGMKWGVRRYQNKDGFPNQLGKKHRRRALDVNNTKTSELLEKAYENGSIQAGRDYITGMLKVRARISRSFELGDIYGQEIRSKIDKTTYSTKAKKREAINEAFSKKLREVEQTGDSALCDSVWQQWNFALDELG